MKSRYVWMFLFAILVGCGGFFLLHPIVKSWPYRPLMVSCFVGIILIKSIREMLYRRHRG